MAIKIKRSTGDLAPAELAAGQLAYSEGAINGGTLYYGEVGGTVREIAGKKFVDKLNGIEAGAQVNTVTSVAGKTGDVTLTSTNITDFNSAVQAVSINDIVEDTTPQLGGNLDVNGKNIVSVNADININPGGGGSVIIKNGLILDSQVVRGGPNQLLLLTDGGGSVGQDVRINMEDSKIAFGNVGNGQRSYVSATTGVFHGNVTGNLTGNVTGNTNGNVTTDSIVSKTSNTNLVVAPNGTGKIKLDYHFWPKNDGLLGHVLVTNGEGVLSWTSVNDLTSSVNSGEIITALGYTPEDAAQKGKVNGYASLDSAGLVPSTQLPSYVDDVLEFAELTAFPTVGESGKIYVAVDTGKTYRWSGTVYVEISASPGSTDAVTEGQTNLYYTDTRARNAISVSGDLSYDKTTGVISYSEPDLATVATSGSYSDLTDKPTLFSGSYGDLTDKPTLFSGSYTDLTDKPSLATVATSGSYTDLTDKPTLFSGDYEDLTNRPDLSVYLAEVSEDTTPSLGGNLDVNGNSIVSTDNGNINIVPDGTGEVIMNAAIVKFGDNGDTGNANFGSQSGNTRIQGQITPTPGGVITLTGGTNGGITITPAGTGSTSITSGSLSVANGGITSGGVSIITNTHSTSSSFVLAQAHSTADANNFSLARARGTWANQSAVQSGDELAEFFVSGNDGSATTAAGLKAAWFWNTTMTDAPSTGLMPHRTDYRVNTTADQFATYMSVANDAVVRVREIGTTSDVTNLNISAGTDGNIQLSPNGTGKVVISGLNYPTADGTANQVLKTDGSGNLSFVDQAAGVTTFVGLSDTPANFTSSGGYYVKVNSGATALEFSQDVDDGTF